jgi:hypothetical protein
MKSGAALHRSALRASSSVRLHSSSTAPYGDVSTLRGEALEHVG